MKQIFLFLLFFVPLLSFGQKTKVEGVVLDGLTGEPMPFVSVHFQNSKIGTLTDSVGYYMLDTYYGTDSLIFYSSGYLKQIVAVEKDESQEINITLNIQQSDIEEVVVVASGEWPSTILHKKVIANKPINDKEKLESYEYEVYNKVEMDLNNIGEKFTERGIVRRLDLVMDYLDSTEDGKSVLPVILSENVSDFYFKNNPKKKKEVVKASRISGMENIQLNQFMGDMYLDINIYDNYIQFFNKSFISPVSNYARSFYKFYLEDSTFIDNQWCYKLRFRPKRTGDVTFTGEMWIHDTTYAVKSFKADISPGVNINYVQGMYIEHNFDMVAPEVWMLTEEKMIVDLKIARKTEVYGFFGRRHSTRKNFRINEPRPDEFYRSDNAVEMVEGAQNRSDEYWAEVRHQPLSQTEEGIDQMIDSLSEVRFFKFLKNMIYFVSTGYFPVKKIEIGNIYNCFSINPVEGIRTSVALRTSNNFSRKIELGGRIAYGFKDERFKYGLTFRANLSEKKRALLSTYYNYDIEQIGQSSTAASVGSTFGTLLRTGPLDKLTFVEKMGVTLEKDVKKDIVLYGGLEWKEYVALGKANYVRFNDNTNSYDTINSLRTSEITLRYRWAKDEEFIAGAFDRTSVRSRFPIIAVQGIFGVKGVFGSDYNYQKLDLFIEHTAPIGFFGRIKYGINAGYIFGTTAYPFLKVHEGNQSYWLYPNAFNKMNFFEFISDRYITGLLENHWDGLFFDRIPLIKKLKLRLVTTARLAYGSIDPKHTTQMLLPAFTKQFGDTPYVEVAAGIENIFSVGRIDVFWRLTHLPAGVKVTDLSNFGVRARYAINF
ncbi:MAG: carboxypeptidase-like regulatory domain-containing protein [Flavobacteriales bacterium]|nr:carboxypeptidase-like regulatory domain-containing protein [Flavobacteriales bacterium]